jgi:hypothetical protein
MSLADNPAGSLGQGRQTIKEAGKPVQLSTTTTGCNWVAITAETDNTGIITIGGSGVVAKLEERKGLPLEKGDSTTIPVGDLAQVYIDTTVNGDGVTFIYGIA